LRFELYAIAVQEMDDSKETQYLIGESVRRHSSWRTSVYKILFYSTFISAIVVAFVESIFILQNGARISERRLGVGDDINRIVPPGESPGSLFPKDFTKETNSIDV
jgi:hypothetical protein